MPYVEKHCPYCNADEESHLMRDPDGHTFECDRCGCEWDERKPGEISFAYDDPRENEGATQCN